MNDDKPVIDVEAEVIPMSTPDQPERDTAQELVEQTIEERKRWIAAWHAQLIDPEKAMLEPFPADAVGCAPGSCQLKVGDRLIAKFVVRYREEPIGVEIEADWPMREVEEGGTAGQYEVIYEEIGGRCDFACEELHFEGTAREAAEMKRKLHAKYGFRFSFKRA